MRFAHAMPFGAQVEDTGVRFRLWAPAARTAEVLVHEGEEPQVHTARSADGWWECQVASAAAGTRYQWRVDGGQVVPDPASRSNPEGPNGPSVVVDARSFEWSELGWVGRSWPET